MFESIGNYGVIGGGLIAFGIFLYTWFFGKSGRTAKFDLKKIMDKVQKDSEDKIESISHEHSQIEVKLKNKEKLAVERQIAIRKIADNAAVQVEAIMKEKDLSKLTGQYNSDLEDL